VPGTHGVFKISAAGVVEGPLPVLGFPVIPNAMAFDAQGNLYLTDSVGAIWRYPPGEPGALWLAHGSLAPTDTEPAIPNVGANGIAFYPPNLLYVANTEAGRVLEIPILANGDPDTAALRVVAGDHQAENDLITSIDGIQMSADGDVFGVIAGYPHATGVHPRFAGMGPLVRIDPNGVPGSRVTVLPTDFTAYDNPLSLAFGRGLRDHRSVFVTNGDLPNPDIFFGQQGPGSDLLQAGVGAEGRLGR